tara:strand:- start:769 stop:1983 length:1215 start_codon:yes stop_codon:yes gene_type:complete
MAIDLSQFILSANNSGKQRVTPSEQLGLAYKQQAQNAQRSMQAYQQALGQNSLAAIPLALAMGLERRRADKALGQYEQALTKQAEDRDMMLNQFGANLPKKQQSIWNNMTLEMKEKAIPEIAKSQLIPKEPNFELRETTEGTVRIDKRTGDVFPVTGPDGSQLQVPQKPETQINMLPAEKSEQIEYGKNLQKQYQGYIDRGNSADYKLNTLLELEQAVQNPNAAQGFAANIRAQGKKAADFFGIKLDGLEDDAIIEAIANKLTLQARSPKSSDGGLTGNTSDRDVKFLQASEPGRSRTMAQNLALIKIAKRKAERSIKLRDLAIEHMEKFGTMKGFNKVKKEYNNKPENHIIRPDEKEELKAVFSEKGPSNTVKGKIKDSLTDAQNYYQKIFDRFKDKISVIEE